MPTSPSAWTKRLLIGLICIHAALLAWEASVHSPTIDEIHTLPGGIAHWQTGSLDIVVNNPPHVGLIAAVPVLLSDADMSAAIASRGGRAIGRDFLQTNGPRSFFYFSLGRWACIPFSLLGAVACFAWARAMYGDRPGLLAATLWCFCPNILGQGQLVAHDVPAAALGLLATYCFWRWLKRPDWTRTVVAGVVLGLSLLTKMTALLYLGLWPIMWLIWRLRNPAIPHSVNSWRRDGVKLLVILFLAVDLLNLGYGFQGSLAPLSSFRFRSRSLVGIQKTAEQTSLGQTPVPFPRAFATGIDFQRSVLEGGLPYQFTYVMGQWSTRGWPLFYFYALALKVPLGTWCLLLLSLGARFLAHAGQSRWRDELVLLSPVAALLITASSFQVWTDHIRHVLPALPFIFVWVSRIASVKYHAHPWLCGFAVSALIWSVTSSLWVCPHSISYFNELAGGPLGGHYHLVSSNIDYGQDLLKLKQWYDQHPEARPFGLAYWDLDSVDPRLGGIEYYVPPSGPAPGSTVAASDPRDFGPKPGWYAVNVNLLRGDTWPGRRTFRELGYYGYFLEFRPVATAGYSIYIYHLMPEDVNKVRKKLGLPLL